MGVRLTGFSTPIFGANWEYSESKNKFLEINSLEAKKKLNVFISSNISESYTPIRKKLKEKILKTGIANVYMFEDNGSSTMSAQQEYLSELEDSDICIFLIDNYDGIGEGTQKEIDDAQKHQKKSLYYFCDERSKEKTSVEQSILGANNVKISHVHSFSDFSVNGFNDLIKDIVSVYHNYCQGRLLYYDNFEETQKLELPSTNLSLIKIPKSVLKEVDKCKITIEKFVLNKERLYGIEIQSTNEIDDWCNKFLNILLKRESIKNFNLNIYLNVLKDHQDEENFKLTKLRWEAIQYYFLGDIEKCIEKTEKSLEFAKKTQQQSWVIKDILIDLRNQKRTRNASKNIVFSKSKEQDELSRSDEQLYYPIMDRIVSSLREQYVNSLYKSELDSPFSVTFGSNIDLCVELIASAYILAMYNGSLTHILLLYARIKELLFYLSTRFDDWELKCNLLKLEIFDGNRERVKKLLNTFPVLLNKMNSQEAYSIIEFASNHSIKYKRELSQIVGFGCVGYYLEEQNFKDIYEQFKTFMIEWLNKDKSVLFLGDSILYAVDNIGYRIPPNELARICCDILENHYNKWFNKVFSIINTYVNIKELDKDTFNKLIYLIEKCFDNKNERDELSSNMHMLINLRKQDKKRTELLDAQIKKYFPHFYNDRYELELTDDDKFYINYISKCITEIKDDNEKQGENGYYFDTAIDYSRTIISILIQKKVCLSSEMVKKIVDVGINTLLYSKQDISTKNNSILLLLMMFKYYANSKDYSKQINELKNNRSNIETDDILFISSNINVISIEISLNLLLNYLGLDVYSDLIKLFSLLKNDIATISSVSEEIDNFLEIIDGDVLDDNISIIILQNALNWLRNDYLNTRWHALNIIMSLSKNGNYNSILNNEIIHLIDNDSPYIKTRILRLLGHNSISSKTKKYVESKCENDANYVVRKVLQEIKEK